MSGDDALKLVVVELQKAAQVRSELLNTLMELELFSSQTSDLKRKIADEYLKKITNLVQGNVEESATSLADDFIDNVPTKDQELRCFPVVRRSSKQSKLGLNLKSEELDEVVLFDA